MVATDYPPTGRTVPDRIWIFFPLLMRRQTGSKFNPLRLGKLTGPLPNDQKGKAHGQDKIVIVGGTFAHRQLATCANRAAEPLVDDKFPQH